MKKRVCIIFLALLLLLPVMASLFAASAESGVALVGDLIGTTATLDVSLSDVEGATNGRITVSYDADLFTFEQAQPADPDWIVSVNSVTDGEVSFAWLGSSFDAGENPVVTMVFRANDRKTFGTFIVTAKELYNSGEPLLENAKLEESLTLTPTLPPFTDIEGHWAEDIIIEAWQNGWVNGMTPTTYEPEGTATRGQFATILWRIAGEPDAAPAHFVDVAEGRFYTTAINWANSIGVVLGTGADTASPEKNILRQEAVTMLYRYADYLGFDVSGRGDLSAFGDADTVSNYAKDAMAWAVDCGIINGDRGNLEAQRNITRAEMAAILVRFAELMQ